MLLANSVEDAEEVINRMENIEMRFSIEINKQKSNVIIFIMKEIPDKTRNISVKDHITYLGITINGRRNCFKTQRK